MTGILGVSPPPDDSGSATVSPEVARDVQRDALVLARSDAWLNLAIAIAMSVATAFVAASMFFTLGRIQLRESGYQLLARFALINVIAIVAAVRCWRRYRQIAAAVASDTVVTDAAGAELPQLPRRDFFIAGAAPIILLALLMILGLEWQRTRHGATGPIVFRNATIVTSTGSVQEFMTVGLANGRIAFVGGADDPLPSALARARRIDAMTAMISAATFDHSVASPLDALRHTWAGQLYEGAPGDLIISSYAPFRGRGRASTPVPREFLGAVVDGRYYTASELRPGR